MAWWVWQNIFISFPALQSKRKKKDSSQRTIVNGSSLWTPIKNQKFDSGIDNIVISPE